MTAKCEICNEVAQFYRVRINLGYQICKKCGHCVQVIKNTTLDEHFDRAQEQYFAECKDDGHLSRYDREAHDFRTCQVKHLVKSGAHVLEIGPGTGAFAEWASNCGYDVVLAEHSETSAKRLADRLGLEVVIGEFSAEGHHPESFDAVFCYHVIEHVKDPAAFLSAAYNVTKPGGVAFLATPSSHSWQQQYLPRLSPNFDSAHIRVFSPESMESLCRSVGWEVADSRTNEFSSGWLRVISKLFRILMKQDEEVTAGSYSRPNFVKNQIFALFRITTLPARRLQCSYGAGNEIFIILRKPRIPMAEAIEVEKK